MAVSIHNVALSSARSTARVCPTAEGNEHGHLGNPSFAPGKHKGGRLRGSSSGSGGGCKDVAVTTLDAFVAEQGVSGGSK